MLLKALLRLLLENRLNEVPDGIKENDVMSTVTFEAEVRLNENASGKKMFPICSIGDGVVGVELRGPTAVTVVANEA